MKVFDSACFRMTGWYVAILMAISLAFSIWVYSAARHELRIGLEAQTSELTHRPSGRVIIASDEARAAVEQRLAESRQRLLISLIVFNAIVLAAGALGGYFLAKRTLRPIREAAEAQNRFTADASHELRTPLTAMKAEIEVGMRDKNLSHNEAVALLNSNLEEVDRLGGLAESLLTLTQSDEPLELRPVNLAKAVAKAAKRVHPLAAGKSIAIEQELGAVTVQGDAQALDKIICILLDNAIKYSPESTAVILKTYPKDGHGVLEVHDQGVGIKATELPHIFDRFYRADTSRTKNRVPGHGLGLSIAQKLAHQMHADIEASSTPGKGSVFRVEIAAT